MALTMTRTRTQTTLTKLAELVAHVHGELEFVEGLLACNGCGGDSSTGHRQQRGAAGSASELDEEPRGRLVARRRILPRSMSDRARRSVVSAMFPPASNCTNSARPNARSAGSGEFNRTPRTLVGNSSPRFSRCTIS